MEPIMTATVEPENRSQLSNSMAITLSTENLVKSYSRKGRTVVDQVSISVGTGEIVGLLGPNGAGKSTTFYMIVGSIRPNSGRIFYNDREITSLPMYQRARLGLGYLPQETSIFRKLTVAENISSVLEVRGLPKGELQKRQNQLMSELGLSSLANQKAYTLSGGECRRAEIARSLAIDPNFMLLDEPFSGIDPIAVQEIKQLVFQLKERGLGILITDHNAAEMLDIVDRAYLITDGKISLSGTPTELLSSQMARERYFGNSFNLPVKKIPTPNSSDETGHTD